MTDVERFSDYFARQIALYCRMIEEQDIIARHLDAGALDEAEALAASHARESAILEREFNALLNEWKASSHPAEAEQAVRKLAAEAAALAEKLERRVNEAAGSARERRASVRREWEAIRRGQHIIDKYRTTDRDDSARMDRHA